ncbi:MAG: hypothetical protein AAGF85_16745 [Bacteroidota bacterium]
MFKVYKLFNLLNLDVVFGAIISSMAFAVFLGVNVEASVYVLLGSTVWIIYTFDRLMDTKGDEQVLQSDRHSFHKKYFQRLGWLIVICTLVSIALLFIIDSKTLLWGVVLSGGVFGYLCTIHLIKIKWLLHKELVVAIIYTAGVIIGPLSIFEGSFSSSFFLCVAVFFLVALKNLLIFSLYDMSFDKKAGLSSVVTILGTQPIKIVIAMISILISCISILGYIYFGDPLLLILLFMTIPLFIIFKFSETRFCQMNFRYIGDAVFLMPVILL